MCLEKKPKSSIRACFGPANECSNCKNKGADLLQCPPNDEDHVLQPNNKALSGFKRCSACHVVAYCSEVNCSRDLFTIFVFSPPLISGLPARALDQQPSEDVQDSVEQEEARSRWAHKPNLLLLQWQRGRRLVQPDEHQKTELHPLSCRT